MAGHLLAHLNVATLRAPMDSPLLAPFVAQLDAINAVADGHRGFVWRMTEEDPAELAALGWDRGLLINLSLWQDVDSLAEFVYRSAHRGVLRARADWFEPQPQPTTVLWWLEAGRLPTLTVAAERLAHLRAHGESAHAFGFRRRFAADGSA